MVPTDVMFVLVRAVSAVVDLVTEAPSRDALEVVTAEVCLLRARDVLADLG